MFFVQTLRITQSSSVFRFVTVTPPGVGKLAKRTTFKANTTLPRLLTSVPELTSDFHQRWRLFNGVSTASEACLTAGTIVVICVAGALFIQPERTDHFTSALALS